MCVGWSWRRSIGPVSPVPSSNETRDAPFSSSTTSATGFPIVNALREIGNVNMPLARMDRYLGLVRDLPRLQGSVPADASVTFTFELEAKDCA
jgi:hypothetical protein